MRRASFAGIALGIAAGNGQAIPHGEQKLSDNDILQEKKNKFG